MTAVVLCISRDQNNDDFFKYDVDNRRKRRRRHFAACVIFRAVRTKMYKPNGGDFLRKLT